MRCSDDSKSSETQPDPCSSFSSATQPAPKRARPDDWLHRSRVGIAPTQGTWELIAGTEVGPTYVSCTYQLQPAGTSDYERRRQTDPASGPGSRSNRWW